jgi:site-specific DNA recombinase
VGGTPVLGYDVDPRGGRLVVNPKEAKQVQAMFELYRRHRSLPVVVEELTRRGWTTKSWRSKRGRRHTGRPFTKASLTHLLTNPVYAGRVEYRGTVYPGQHAAIVDPGAWEDVNQEFRARERSKTPSVRTAQNALLAGLLFCTSCKRPMVATYSMKRGHRYRYYVCHSARQKGWTSCPTKSVSASLIEDSLLSQLRIRLSLECTRSELRLPDQDWQAFLHDPVGLVPVLVESVGYEGTSGTVSVRLRPLNSPFEETRS